MSMDLTGRRPKNDAGREFSTVVFWWSPLVSIMQEAAPRTFAQCPSWWLNDGQGMDATDARTLGRKLRETVEQRGVERWAREHQGIWREAEETPRGTVPAHWKVRMGGQGSEYGVRPEKVLELADFLENSGGFEIW